MDSFYWTKSYEIGRIEGTKGKGQYFSLGIILRKKKKRETYQVGVIGTHDCCLKSLLTGWKRKLRGYLGNTFGKLWRFDSFSLGPLARRTPISQATKF